MSDQTCILVAEDHPILRDLVVSQLSLDGYRVVGVANGQEALETLAQEHFHLLLTDIQMVGGDGMALIREARLHDPTMEIVVITGRGSIESAIVAINNGARAYLIKPMRMAELRATISNVLQQHKAHIQQQQLLRRIGADLLRLAEGSAIPYQIGPQAAKGAEDPYAKRNREHIFEIGSLAIDTQRHLVTHDGRSVALSNGEFSLLAYLARHREQVVSAQQLVTELQGYTCTPQEARDLIKARVWSLRQKIEPNPARPTLLISVRGAGYVLTAEGRGGDSELR
jgi:DNA-binding response OmpR family regulator